MSTNKKRILVIEDEEYLRDLYVQLLKEEGYEVDQAADGQQGYDAMYKDGYDLVLLDIMLPLMDGLTILEKLKTVTSKTTNRQILLMTNLGQDHIVARALTLGVKGYLTKSDYTPDQLLHEIKKYIGEEK